MASWQGLALLSKAQPALEQALDNPTCRAVPDLFLALNSLFLGLAGAVGTSVFLLGRVKAPWAKVTCWISIVFAGCAFAYLFFGAGAADIPFDKYVHEGKFVLRFSKMIPDWSLWVNKLRIAVFADSLILTVVGISLKNGKSE